MTSAMTGGILSSHCI